MKKRILTAVLLLAAFLTSYGQVPAKPPAMKLEDVQKALVLIEKPEPAPAEWKAGFDLLTPANVLAMLSFASSDWMEGRETGAKGFLMAADYAISLFKMWGLKPGGDMGPASFRFQDGQVTQTPGERTFFQAYSLREVEDIKGSLGLEVRKGDTIKKRLFRSGVDFGWYSSGTMDVTAPVVFIGYGIQESKIGWDELKGLNLKGKIVLVLSEAPGKDDPKSPFQAKELKDKYLPTSPAVYTPGSPARYNKLTELAKLGPAAILVVSNAGQDVDTFKNLAVEKGRPVSTEQPFPKIYSRRLSLLGAPPEEYETAGSVTISVTREIADAILEGAGTTIDELKKKIETIRKPASAELPGTRLTLQAEAKTTLVKACNVVAILEGSDPKLKDEYLVIGAHYDGLGASDGNVWNGADDNASGSIGVLAIAQAMVMNPKKPKRSVVFCLWSGEEEGLFGSRFYVAHPLFPLAKTVGCINFDMISRAYDDTTSQRPLRKYKIPGSEELLKKIRPAFLAGAQTLQGGEFADWQRRLNAFVGLDLILDERAQGTSSAGSDHNPFDKAKIPYIYYDAASTTDYHKVTDSVEKVAGDLYAKIIRLGYLTACAVADK
ncbi:MAG: M28 family peptidase [Acidobacteriota bacterium]|nr:M28 family peptidase [Acidobacteriota bacterium]